MANSKEPVACTISMPKIGDQAMANLQKIIANKGELMKHAFQTDSLAVTVNEETGEIDFPWFTITEDLDGTAYSLFISMLIQYASDRKWVPDKPDVSTNEKYAFRCFLLRIGMIGEEFKPMRKVLLRNLTGNSARSKA